VAGAASAASIYLMLPATAAGLAAQVRGVDLSRLAASPSGAVWGEAICWDCGPLRKLFEKPASRSATSPPAHRHRSGAGSGGCWKRNATAGSSMPGEAGHVRPCCCRFRR